MSSLFPFVSVPAKSTVDLRREHPCLFKAMITVASWQNRSLQNRRGEDLTRDLTFRLLIEGEKSLDLLQAMLVRWIWYVISSLSCVWSELKYHPGTIATLPRDYKVPISGSWLLLSWLTWD